MRIQSGGERDLGVRTKAFAIRIIRLYSALPKNTVAQTIGKQLIRSGTSVGAHIAEANFGRSRAEFVSKIEGALQEIQETRYWLELLAESNSVKPERLTALMTEATELTAVLVTVAKRTRPVASVSA